MALNNFTALKASIANWLNRSDLTDAIQDDFIKLCEADFNAKLRIRQMEQIETITIDSETEDVPTGFIATRSFYIIQGGIKYALDYVAPSTLFRTYGASQTGRPRAYTIEADEGQEKLRFAPAPDATYTGYLQYYKAFDPLSASTATNYILTNHPSIYLYGSLYHAANFLGGIEPNQLQQWLGMYQAGLERCENNDRQDSYGSTPVQRPDVT